jgi:murein DD-endopeptidase MepM/ murein hydrolase activator NlpD
VQHRANRTVRGRHRRTDALPSHRAPGTPVVLRGRRRGVVLGAALVAGVGVGVAGVSAATASATPAHVDPNAHAVAHTQVTPSSPAMSGTDAAPSATAADAEIAAVESVQIPPTALSFARTLRKDRPVPVAVAAAATAAQWVNPLPEASVTSCFGQRWGRLHAGVDLAAPDGTRIRAAGAGVVVAAGPAAGYGNAVLIDHGNGFLTHYGHMSVVAVTVGQHVAVGEQIGNEGSTGHSTGPHLHFEVHQGSYKNPIEPTQWMHDHGVDIPGCVTFTN